MILGENFLILRFPRLFWKLSALPECFDFFPLVVTEYRFGIASLINKKELLQIGDAVQFNPDMKDEFAVNIHATREKLRSIVEAMKGNLEWIYHIKFFRI